MLSPENLILISPLFLSNICIILIKQAGYILYVSVESELSLLDDAFPNLPSSAGQPRNYRIPFQQSSKSYAGYPFIIQPNIYIHKFAARSDTECQPYRGIIAATRGAAG